MPSNEKRKAARREAERVAVRRAIERQYEMTPGALDPARIAIGQFSQSTRNLVAHQNAIARHPTARNRGPSHPLNAR